MRSKDRGVMFVGDTRLLLTIAKFVQKDLGSESGNTPLPSTPLFVGSCGEEGINEIALPRHCGHKAARTAGARSYWAVVGDALAD